MPRWMSGRWRAISAPSMVFMLAYSLVCYSIFYLMVVEYSQTFNELAYQLKVLVVLSALLLACSVSSPSRTTLASCYMARGIFAVIVVALLGGARADMEIVFIVPLVIEAWVRERTLLKMVVFAITMAFSAAFDYLALRKGGQLAALIHSAVLLIVVIPVPMAVVAFDNISKRLVRSQRNMERLQEAIVSLSNSNIAYQNYAEVSKVRSAEDERNRITREIHDLVGYSLTNIIMMMNAVKIFLPELPGRLSEAMELVDQTKNQADSTLQECRKILYMLRSAKLEGTTGLQALAILVKSFMESTHVLVTLSFGNISTSCGDYVDDVIYRIVQEGLTNAIKHGKADKITVSLWKDEEDVYISVRDNGVGAGDVVEGIGLKGMRERIASLGGKLEVDGARNGFLLVATMPLGRAEGDGVSDEPY